MIVPRNMCTNIIGARNGLDSRPPKLTSSPSDCEPSEVACHRSRIIQDEWPFQVARLGWSKLGFLFCILTVSLVLSPGATMEITAFEYKRKFHKTLNLGECSQRELAHHIGNNTRVMESQTCTFFQQGQVRHEAREVSDTKNVLISSAEDVISQLGLCGGEAASFLGILNTGDCVSIEMASRLTFSDKTMVRALVGTYQTGMDVLESLGSYHEGFEGYYRDKFFLKNRSYGSLEIVLVQLRFDSTLATQEAKKVRSAGPLMSSYLRQIQNTVGVPRHAIFISLSTASQDMYLDSKDMYQMQQYKHEDWERAVRHMQILELNIERTREHISKNSKNYHLIYRLEPFLQDTHNSRLSSPPIPNTDWADISQLEVQLRQAINLVKKTLPQCRRVKSKPCHRLRELKNKLLLAQTEVHAGRSNWVRLTADEKGGLVSQYKTNVKSYTTVTKNVVKSVKEMVKNAKKAAEKTTKSPNTLNQIPVNIEEPTTHRRMQLSSSRARNRIIIHVQAVS